MEWNGNGYGTRIGHYGLDWALGSGGSMMTDDDDVSPYFLPTDTLVRVRPCLHTSSAACYTGLRPRGGGGG